MTNARELERDFERLLQLSGYEFQKDGRLEAPRPVENKYREKVKTVYNVDFVIYKQINKRRKGPKFIEVTTGRGESPHKRSQRLVSLAAGAMVRILCSSEIEKLVELSETHPEKINKMMRRIIGF